MIVIFAHLVTIDHDRFARYVAPPVSKGPG